MSKRISKGKQERINKIRTRQDKNAEKMLKNSVFKNLNFMQQGAIISLIREQTKETEREYEIIGYEKGMMDAFNAIGNVLKEEFWKKTFPKRYRYLIEHTASLMDSKLYNTVTFEEMADFITKESGFNFTTEWMSKDVRPTPDILFKEVEV